MDELQKINRIELRGTLADRPHYSHENRDERFFVFPISIPRLSGAVDRINVLAREEQLKNMEICELPKIYVSGELRSFNNKSGEGSRLVITVFARELRFDEGESLNTVWLTGTICKPPNLRTTPMGREICDLMLAVNRKYGRSDYLPCIAWGLRAKEAALWPVGTNISITGRIQSRNYIKNQSGLPVEKTTYEVSATELTEIQKI
jgi:single-strand DNA-binding protein